MSEAQKEDKLIYQDEQNPDRSWSISVPEEGSYRVLSIGEGTDERNLVYIQFDKGAEFIPVIKEFEATSNFFSLNNRQEDNNKLPERYYHRH